MQAQKASWAVIPVCPSYCEDTVLLPLRTTVLSCECVLIRKERKEDKKTPVIPSKPTNSSNCPVCPQANLTRCENFWVVRKGPSLSTMHMPSVSKLQRTLSPFFCTQTRLCQFDKPPTEEKEEKGRRRKKGAKTHGRGQQQQVYTDRRFVQDWMTRHSPTTSDAPAPKRRCPVPRLDIPAGHQPTHSTSAWRFSLRQLKFQVQSRLLCTFAFWALQGQSLGRSLATSLA